MRTIDYLSVFLLLSSAPAWQAGLDGFSAGLGSALLVLLMIGAIRTSQPTARYSNQIRAKTGNHTPTKEIG